MRPGTEQNSTWRQEVQEEAEPEGWKTALKNRQNHSRTGSREKHPEQATPKCSPHLLRDTREAARQAYNWRSRPRTASSNNPLPEERVAPPSRLYQYLRTAR